MKELKSHDNNKKRDCHCDSPLLPILTSKHYDYSSSSCSS